MTQMRREVKAMADLNQDALQALIKRTKEYIHGIKTEQAERQAILDRYKASGGDDYEIMQILQRHVHDRGDDLARANLQLRNCYMEQINTAVDEEWTSYALATILGVDIETAQDWIIDVLRRRLEESLTTEQE